MRPPSWSPTSSAADAFPLLTVPLPGTPLAVSRKTLVALAPVHVRGLRLGRVVQNGLTALKVASLALFVSLGFSIGHSVPAQLAAPGTTGIAPMLLALIPIMFAYSGWKAGAYVAEETRSPERNVPLALGLGTLAVIVIYLDPWTSTAGLAVIAAGMPMYWWMRAGQSVRP